MEQLVIGHYESRAFIYFPRIFFQNRISVVKYGGITKPGKMNKAPGSFYYQGPFIKWNVRKIIRQLPQIQPR